MRKLTTLFLLLTLVSCGSYTMSTFYVKNTSDKTVSFDASVMKFSQSGPYDVNQSFTVKPNDSVLARKLKLAFWHPIKFRALIQYPKNIELWDEYSKIFKYEGVAQAHNYYLENKKM